MTSYYGWGLLSCFLAASLVSGCALLSKADQGAVRFFSLEGAPVRPVGQHEEPPVRAGAPGELRLGGVTGAIHLEARLVYRDSPHELGYYRELRWTEPPDVVLGRLLAAALFESRGLRRVVGGAATTLNVELTCLEEIRGPEHLARVRVVARLHDDHWSVWEGTVTVERPVPEVAEEDAAVALVTALSEALQAAVDQLADRVVTELQEPR